MSGGAGETVIKVEGTASSPTLWQTLGPVWRWSFRAWFLLALLTVFGAVRNAHSRSTYTDFKVKYALESPLEGGEYAFAEGMGIPVYELYRWWPKVLLVVLVWGVLLGLQALETSIKRSPGTSLLWRKIMWLYQGIAVIFGALLVRGAHYGTVPDTDPTCGNGLLCRSLYVWPGDKALGEFLGMTVESLYSVALYSLLLLVVSVLGINLSYRLRAVAAILVIPLAVFLIVFNL